MNRAVITPELFCKVTCTSQLITGRLLIVVDITYFLVFFVYMQACHFDPVDVKYATLVSLSPSYVPF